MALTVGSVPAGEPSLRFLVGGFVALVAGLAIMTRRRPAGSITDDPAAISRASGYALVYIVCATCFARVLSPALLGDERSPWLLALGDVLCVTLGLFAWVISLAEARPWSEYGFRGAPVMRLAIAIVLGIAVAAFYSGRHWAALFTGRVALSADAAVFAVAFALIASAFAEEMLFRGYLMSALETRHSRWASLAVSALAFAVLRALRHLPGHDLTVEEWLRYVLGVAVPLGLWWGFVRDLARGSLWPTLLSNLLLELGRVLAGAPPVALTSRG